MLFDTSARAEKLAKALEGEGERDKQRQRI